VAAAATRHGRTLIAVVLDSPNPPADAAQLMNWGFAGGGFAGGGFAGGGFAGRASASAWSSLPPYVRPAGVSSLVPSASIPAASVVSLALPVRRAAVARVLPAGRFAGEAAAVCGVLLAGAAVAVTTRRRRRRFLFSDVPGETPPSSSL